LRSEASEALIRSRCPWLKPLRQATVISVSVIIDGSKAMSISNPFFDPLSGTGDNHEDKAREVPLATLRPLRQFRPPSKSFLNPDEAADNSMMNVAGSDERLRSRRNTRLSMPNESFLFFVDDNDTTSNATSESTVVAQGDTSDSFTFKAMPRNTQRRWSSNDGGQTYMAFNDGIDDDDMMTESGYTGSLGSHHSRMPLHPLDFELEDIYLGVGTQGDQTVMARSPPFSRSSNNPSRRSSATVIKYGIRGLQNQRYEFASRLEFVMAAFSLVHCSPDDFGGHDETSCGFLLAYLLSVAFVVYPVWYVQSGLSQYPKQGCLGVWKVLPVCVGLPIFATLLSVAESLLAGSKAATFFMDLINAIEVSVQPEVACDSVLQGRVQEMSCPAKPAFSFVTQQPVLQWPLALLALIIWTCILIMTCYAPMKVTAKTLKFTALLPLAMQLTYMAKAFLANPEVLTTIGSNLAHLKVLCEFRLWVIAATLAIRLTLCASLAIMTLASMNRSNQPFHHDLVLIVGLHCLTAVMSILGGSLPPWQASLGLSLPWRTLYPVAMTCIFVNRLLVLSECLLVSLEDIHPVLRRFRPFGATALAISGLLGTLFLFQSGAEGHGYLKDLVTFSSPLLLLLLMSSMVALYKIQNFYDNNITLTIGSIPNHIESLYMWLLCPIILAIVFAGSLVYFTTPDNYSVWLAILLMTIQVFGAAIGVVFWAWRSGYPLQNLLEPDWNSGKTHDTTFIEHGNADRRPSGGH